MNQLTREAVATEVRVALTRKGVTQAKLAEAIGMSTGTLSDRLAGRSAFDTDELNAIGAALGVSPFGLLGAA